jgi:flavin reductase (DIM6/NTAB) family NADH-FMN oxidoreductase RutF
MKQGGNCMHTFQPYPIGLLEINPFTKISKEWALVTAGTKAKSNTMTVSWGGAGELWGKNVAFIFIRESRYTKEFIDRGEFFTVSFLDEEYRDALQYCGANSGRKEDKWSGAHLTPSYRHGIPYPDEANLVVICSKMAAVPLTENTFISPDIKTKWYADGDMHTMYIGEIVEVMAR